MQVLYISALASESRISELYRKTGNNPGFAVQKFSRLLVRGLQANGVNVLAFSNPPNLGGKNCFVPLAEEKENGVSYKYVPYLNVPVIKHLCILFYTFIYILCWGLKNKKDKAIVCDVLSVSICMGALFASKLNGVMSVGVVTDIYGQMVGMKGLLASLASRLNKFYVSSFDRYVLLTEQMNEVVNPHDRPYMVMEALCDSTEIGATSENIEKAHPRMIIYAGGIYEKYGLKMLAEGFIEANVDDAKLVYYGSGSYVEEFKALCAKHSNLEYRGVAANDVVMAEERKATLLVNPRFATEELTKYSFPSKNMEYMSTGTPLLTTKLPGMPKEYYKYVYLLEEETVSGYANAIRRVMNYSETELRNLGSKAKAFVLKNKNDVAQGKRILQMILDTESK